MSKITIFSHLPNAVRTRSGILRPNQSLEVEVSEVETLVRLYGKSISKIEGKISAIEVEDLVPSKPVVKGPKSKKDKDVAEDATAIEAEDAAK